MTEALRIRGLSDEENGILNRLLEQLEQKSTRNLLRSSYYDGKRAVQQVGTVIPPQYQNIGLALGWAAKGVDGLARRCNLERMVWAGGDLDSLGMDDLADGNFLFSEIDQSETDSLLHGVSYLITTAGNVSAGEPKALIHAKDALNATGDWNARTRKLDNLLSVTKRDDGRITGFVLYLNNLTISAEKGPNNAWAIDRFPHSWGVPVEPMPYSARSSRRMGHSRISRPVMGYQDAALRALIRLEAHMDIYTIPKMILLGASEAVFKNADGSPKASWQVALGRVFGVPDYYDATNPRADVKQFAAESPAPHLAQLNALAKLMARETDLPDGEFAMTDMANPTSAEAIERGDEPLIYAAEDATRSWSVPIRRTVTRALAIQNGLSAVPDTWSGIKADWRKPRYQSKSAAADAGAKQIATIPWLAETEVGLEILGLDAQQIERAMAQKAAAERRASGRAVIAALTPAAPVVAADAVSA